MELNLIKEFFSESMKNDQGEDVSTREIKKILENIILEEDKKKPLTDDKLAANMLKRVKATLLQEELLQNTENN